MLPLILGVVAISSIFKQLKVEPMFLKDEKLDQLYAQFICNKIFYFSYGELIAFSVDALNANKSTWCLDSVKSTCYMSDKITKRDFSDVEKHKQAIINNSRLVHLLKRKDFEYYTSKLIKLECIANAISIFSDKKIKVLKKT